jgi:tRNA threonylcarbamoyladenosine modification (KEOPS) complex  Pcc1 subunit
LEETGERASPRGAVACIAIEFDSKAYSKAIFKALKPELRIPFTSRSKVEMNLRGKSIALKIRAKDLTALRAAVNSYLRWLLSCFKSLKAVV